MRISDWSSDVCSSDLSRHVPTFLAGDVGRQRLHDAVADHPGREETADLPEVPAENTAQINRQGHYEPDVAGTEQEHPGRRQNVDRPALGQDVTEPWFGFRFTQVLFQQEIGRAHV